MSLERVIAKLFRMDDKTFRKHSNPWSGYTRLPLLIPLTLALWSRAWIGWWAVVPVVTVLVWVWVNPRIFPEPKKSDAWVSKGVLGEWVWVNQGRIEIPKHHRRAPKILRTVAAVGIVPYVWGLVFLDPWPTALGVVLMYLGKLWFVDRMVWLYEDVKDKVQPLASEQ
ncbi:MAG: DUF6653 family protein [Zestosphaera sp.]